ncbi:LapA family protein [Aminithiophilus ramosus]|uniref:LapA family protein n=2 Tax=Synergistales TaxID=649776 RepID=A0A9Q7AM95_9BACT|nr:LapA family protein [Aminithiophilus ramosus]QTX31562.1 LapA family protein [Aminithiophilus ramosus]QVL35369.1 LapA family protein [Synergistota bacterium]
MKSYALAVALAMLAAAGYAFQNDGQITVRLLLWSRDVPQGLWEVLLFSAGGVLMWLIALAAQMEMKGSHRKALKELRERVETLEKERQSLLAALAGEPRPVVTETEALWDQQEP